MIILLPNLIDLVKLSLYIGDMDSAGRGFVEFAEFFVDNVDDIKLSKFAKEIAELAKLAEAVGSISSAGYTGTQTRILVKPSDKTYSGMSGTLLGFNYQLARIEFDEQPGYIQLVDVENCFLFQQSN